MPVPRLRRSRAVLTIALMVLAATALAAHRWPRSEAPGALPVWRETAWNMPLDNWGEGQAWRATLPDGGEISLHARTKAGFCNCFNGVANDTEIDLIGDVELHGGMFAPLALGAVTRIGDLDGRKRLFEASGKWSGTQRVLSIVVAADCKAVVATLVSRVPISAAAEAAAVALLTTLAQQTVARQTTPVRAETPKIGDPPEAWNMRLTGYEGLQARSAYQPTIHKHGDRTIAYVGHHGGTPKIPTPVNPMTGKAEPNGTSLIDVTDPAHPEYLAHIPGAEGLYEDGGAQMVRVCDGSGLAKADKSAVYMLRTFGNLAHEVWNVADPAKPALVARLDGLKGTHKNWWECDTGIAYLVSGAEGWRVPRMTQIYDMSDPAHPVFIRNFGLPGQEPGSSGPAGNRVYFGYGTNIGGIVQIVDREKLLKGAAAPTPENLLYPQTGRLDLSPLIGAHTVYPMLGVPIAAFLHDKTGAKRDFVMIVNEQILNECLEARQMVWFADITVEAKSMVVSNYTAPEQGGNFCARGGRFG